MAATALEWHACLICGRMIGKRNRAYCTSHSEAERFMYRYYQEHGRTRPCARCGELFERGRGRQLCDECQRASHADTKRRETYNERSKKRARKAGAVYEEHVDPMVVFERDGWVCHICGERVDQSLKFPHVLSVTVDHLVSLSKGGTHSYGNVACAHLICNSRKG